MLINVVCGGAYFEGCDDAMLNFGKHQGVSHPTDARIELGDADGLRHSDEGTERRAAVAYLLRSGSERDQSRRHASM
jgi:hypothetical protein